MTDHSARPTADAHALGRIRGALSRRGAALADRAKLTAGGRRFQLTWPGANGGNLLYLWQRAHADRKAGRRTVVQRSAPMTPWLNMFPMLQSLTVDGEPGRLDVPTWDTCMKPGVSFTRAQNHAFCSALIRSSAGFRSRLSALANQVDESTVVVNVRRGDYYTNPEFSRRFSIDIQGHVSHALELLRTHSDSINDVLLISDDPTWCIENLHIPEVKMRTLQGRTGMFDDLATLALAHRLVLANSTFSYWGAFLGRALEHPQVVAVPGVHEFTEDGRAITGFADGAWLTTPQEILRPDHDSATDPS